MCCNHWFSVLLLIPTLLSYIEGCGRTPATPAPTTPATTTVSGPKHHRLECNANETRSQGCLHGGECFVLDINGRKTYCMCKKDYAGTRCEYLDPNIIFQHEREQKIATAGIAASAVAATLFVTVLIIVIVYHKRYQRNKRQQKQKEEEQKLNGIHTENEIFGPHRRSPNIVVNPSESDNESEHKDASIFDNPDYVTNGTRKLLNGETSV